MTPLVLSLFPGLDLFGKAFSDLQYSVVRGPDLLFCDDVADFHVPGGRFDGVIGGPPCQEFSTLNRDRDQPAGMAMLDEYRRLVLEARPSWWLMENVANVPDLQIEGYSWHRFNLDLAWFADCRRLRCFQFGRVDHDAYDGHPMVLDVVSSSVKAQLVKLPGAVLTNDSRPWPTVKALQGLPPDFDLPWCSVAGKKKLVGNGVPMQMGHYLAATILQQIYGIDAPPPVDLFEPGRCVCGCGRAVYGKAQTAGASCRKRVQRTREIDRAQSQKGG